MYQKADWTPLLFEVEETRPQADEKIPQFLGVRLKIKPKMPALKVQAVAPEIKQMPKYERDQTPLVPDELGNDFRFKVVRSFLAQ
jgi:hypothetical protein